MAQQVIRRFTCDRCEKPYEEPDPESKSTPTVIFSATTTIVVGKDVKYEDLCPKCTGRVLDLLGQIRLDKPDAGEKSPSTTPQAELPGTAAATNDSAAPGSEPATDKKAEQTAGHRASGSTEPTTTH